MISEAIVTIYCDGLLCEVREEFGLNTTARGYNERTLDHDIKAAGWSILGENEHLCPMCTQAAKEETEEDGNA